MIMDLEVTSVPESSITGGFMGFGALAIAVGQRLLRKKVSPHQAPAVSVV